MKDKDQFLIKYDALTVGQLKSLIEEFNLSEQKCMNSNFTEEYTLKLVNKNSFENFEPITGAYLDHNVTFYSPLGNRKSCETISDIAKDLEHVLNDIEMILK